MNLGTASKRILEMRRRLAAITDEREALPDDAVKEIARLSEEENELTTRLAELQDSFSRPAGEAAYDPGFEPQLSRQTLR